MLLRIFSTWNLRFNLGKNNAYGNSCNNFNNNPGYVNLGNNLGKNLGYAHPFKNFNDNLGYVER